MQKVANEGYKEAQKNKKDIRKKIDQGVKEGLDVAVTATAIGLNIGMEVAKEVEIPSYQQNRTNFLKGYNKTVKQLSSSIDKKIAP